MEDVGANSERSERQPSTSRRLRYIVSDCLEASDDSDNSETMLAILLAGMPSAMLQTRLLSADNSASVTVIIANKDYRVGKFPVDYARLDRRPEDVYLRGKLIRF